jgi:hypothetical protein
MKGGVPITAIVLLAISLSASAAPGHHSISGVYDSSRRVTIDGTVLEFQFINPHPFVIVEVVERDRGAQTWRLEMDNRFELAAIGVTAGTLKPGDRVIAAGSAGRTEPNRLYVLSLDRPSDGFRYEQVGSSPRIRERRR